MSSELRNRKNNLVPKGGESDDDEEFKEIIKDIESDHWKDGPAFETRWSKTKSALREWGLSCSWHGIPHMAESLSCCTVLLWTTILCISAVLFVFLITITVKQYFSFQKSVNLNMGMEESNFPSITFCNANPYKLSSVQAIPELEALLNVYSQSLQ